MGLKNTIAKAIQSGFSALGDLKVSVSYYQLSAKGNYNPTTGTTAGDTETLFSFNGIFYAARNREVDGIKILVDDKRLVFEQRVLSITPSHDDRLVVLGESYNIVNVIEDPAQATYILFLRGT